MSKLDVIKVYFSVINDNIERFDVYIYLVESKHILCVRDRYICQPSSGLKRDPLINYLKN